MEAFGALDCGGEAEWWPSSRLLEEVQRKSTDFNVIWFYGSPAWIASGTPHGEPLEEALDGWVRRNRAVLNLRELLGPRLRLVNIEGALAVPASRAHSHPLFRALLGWWGPTYQGMYEVLEAAAWKPLGERRARLEQLAESQLLAILEGFIQEVRATCETVEAAKADKLLARLQETQEDLEVILQERESLRMEMATAAHGHEVELATLRQELADVRHDLVTKQKELDQARQGQQVAAASVAEARADLAKAQKELGASVAARQALDQRVAKELQASAGLLAKLRASEESCATLKGEVAALKARCKELEAKNIEAVRELRERAAGSSGERESPTHAAASFKSGVVRFIPALARRRRNPDSGEREASMGLLRSSEWFDAEWYLETYPDVRAAGLDPVEHYLDFGWKEFRNPGPRFDTTYYLANNIDVAKSGLNPLLHFIRFGASEGRLPAAGSRASARVSP